MAGILDEFLLIFKPQVQGSGFQRLNTQLKTAHDSLFSFKNLFSAFVGYDIYSGIKALFTGFVDASRELGAMNSRFYAITHSAKQAGEELDWVFNLADRTAMSLKSTADSYSIFYAATQKSLGNDGARGVFESWTEISRVLHLTDYQFERVTYALREMASKGAIYSQDLRMQIGTHVPNAMGLAQKAAEEMGITGTDWFEKLQEAAKGNQKLINRFILLFSKNAKKMYASPEALAKALEQPDAQIQRLLNNWQKFRYAITRSGFEKDLVKILKSLNYLLGGLSEHAKEIYKLIKALVVVLTMLGGLKIVKFLISTKYIRSLITTFKYWHKTLGIFRTLGVMLKGSAFVGLAKLLGTGVGALLTTPQGWVILAITAILAGVNWFKKTFPNVWLAFSNYILLLLDYLQTIIRWASGGERNNKKPENPRQAIDAYYRENIAKTGGIYGNTKLGAEAWNQAKLLNQLKIATKSAPDPVLLSILHFLQNKLSKRQADFNIKITNEIKAGNIQEAQRILQEENPAWIPSIINQFKQAIKKN